MHPSCEKFCHWRSGIFEIKRQWLWTSPNNLLQLQQDFSGEGQPYISDRYCRSMARKFPTKEFGLTKIDEARYGVRFSSEEKEKINIYGNAESMAQCANSMVNVVTSKPATSLSRRPWWKMMQVLTSCVKQRAGVFQWNRYIIDDLCMRCSSRGFHQLGHVIKRDMRWVDRYWSRR